MCPTIELIPQALIIHGDGTDEELLKSENIDDMDAFIAMTGMDEENMMAALMAKLNGAKRVIAKISRINYVSIIKNLRNKPEGDYQQSDTQICNG